MIRTRAVGSAVFYADEVPVNAGWEEIEFLKARVEGTVLKRIRLCAHSDVEDALHEMLIVLSKETYIRPAKHLGKAESLLVIEGVADAVFFDEQGEIERVLPLGDYHSGRRFYYRISEPVYHTLLIRSDTLVFHEATRGPFRPEDTVFSPWSPPEDDPARAREYMHLLSERATRLLRTR